MRAAIPLILLLLIGAGVRLVGIDFGLPCHTARPDEELVAQSVLHMVAKGSLQPAHWYYPSFFSYLARAAYGVADRVLPPAASSLERLDRLHLTARGLSALAGTLTILVVFFLGQRARSARVGLMAAAILALAHLHVRDSHFGTTDVTLTLFITLALLPILGAARTDSFRPAVVAGLAAGLAFSVKYTGLVLLAPLAVSLAIRFFPRGAPLSALGRFGGAVALTAAVFVALNPYAIIEPRRFLDMMAFLRDAAFMTKDTPAESTFVRHEIGRASCRERV